ncbi:MAG: RluA family pseudouridine synthase [Patescibacteria group bacterium]
MPEHTLKVPIDIGKQRLDLYLVASLGLSRSRVQQLIRSGAVLISGVAPVIHHWLKAGEVITVVDNPEALIPPPPAPELVILDETEDFLVVVKQAGVLVHPAPNAKAPTLTSALLNYLPAIATVGQPDRPGIVHRLDRDVSGLLVVAKTAAMYDWLVNEFRERRVEKQYTALVHGSIDRDEGLITFPIGRSKTNPGRMAARPSGGEGRSAETAYTVLTRYVNFTLLSVVIHTGRTHQIRTHLNALGHPVVGDALYGKVLAQGVALPRLFLQATNLGFRDSQEVWHRYTLPLDAELATFLTTITA